MSNKDEPRTWATSMSDLPGIDNPLLDFSGLPRFDLIRPEHVNPAMRNLIESARATIESIVADSRPATWDSVAEPLAGALDGIDRAWGAVHHLNAVVSNAEWRLSLIHI